MPGSRMFREGSAYRRLCQATPPSLRRDAFFVENAAGDATATDLGGRVLCPHFPGASVRVAQSGAEFEFIVEGLPAHARMRMLFFSASSLERLRRVQPTSDNSDEAVIEWALADARIDDFDVPRILSSLPDLDATASEDGVAVFRVAAQLPASIWLAVVRLQKAPLEGLTKQITGGNASLSEFLALDTAVTRKEPMDSIWSAAADADSLYVVLAGEDDTPCIHSTPVWYTKLTAAPREIVWLADTEPMQCSLHGIEDGVLYEEEVDQPCLSLPEDTRERISQQSEVYWECVGEQQVRGYFSVEPLAENFPAATADDALATLTAAMRLAELRYFEDSLNLLKGIDAGAKSLAYRSICRVYQMIREELTGERQLGHPEGVWAADLASRYLRRSYELTEE